MFDTIKLVLEKTSSIHKEIYDRVHNPSLTTIRKLLTSGKRLFDLKLSPNYQFFDSTVIEYASKNAYSRTVVDVSAAEGYAKLDRDNRMVHTNRKYDMYVNSLPHSEPKFKSSYYNLIFLHDLNSDEMSVEFSIPKFFYGTNVIQAVWQNNEFGFNHAQGETDTWEFQCERAYDRLLQYIDKFFHVVFKDLHECGLIDFELIRIDRLDVCFNQIFQSEHLKKQVLRYCRSIPKRHVREGTRVLNEKTGIAFGNKEYGFKIYDKGVEFQKNDYRKLKKVNEIEGRNVYDLEALTYLADRTLRYEYTFRKLHFDYLYNQKLFRVDSQSFQRLKNLYNKIKTIDVAGLLREPNLKQKKRRFIWREDKTNAFTNIVDTFKMQYVNDRHLTFLQYFGDCFVKERKDGKFNFDWYEQPQNSPFLFERFFIAFEKLISTSRKYYLKLSTERLEDYREDRKHNYGFQTTKDCLFGGALLKELLDKLWDEVLYYKVEEHPPLTVYLDNLKKYNERITADRDSLKRAQLPITYKPIGEKKKGIMRPLSVNRMSFVLKALEHKTLDELYQELNLGESTKSKLRHDLRLIGWKPQKLIGLLDVDSDFLGEEYVNDYVEWTNKFIDAPLDYNEYFLYMRRNEHLYLGSHTKFFR